MFQLKQAVLAAAILSSLAFSMPKEKTSPKTSALDWKGAAELTSTPEQFGGHCNADLDRAKAKIAELKGMKGQRDTMKALQALDDANLALSNAAARSDLAYQVHPDKAMRDVAEKCTQDVNALATDISLDRGVYDAIKNLDTAKLDPPTKYLYEQTMLQFKRAGVDKDDATRAKIKQLNDELTKIGQDFNRNAAAGQRTVEFTPEELEGLPKDFIEQHPPKDGKITLKTVYPDYYPFMRYAKSSPARERFYREFNNRAYPENMAVLDKLLAKRYELAQTLGYKNWAEYITEDKMIQNATNAANFIEKITSAADARMKKDYDALLAIYREEHPGAQSIEPWDVDYLKEILKKRKYQFDSQAVRPYFEYNRVKDGLMSIVSKMYGVEFRKDTNAKVWHPDVEAYDVMDHGKVLGRIYLDMSPRDNKYGHAANFGLSPGRKGEVLPESVLVCNFPRSTADQPGLMEHSDVVTFFHEFGHLMHSIFSGYNSKWTGYNYQWDYIEAPSQMFEEWTVTPSTLQLFAKNFKTGEVIPAELVKKIKSAKDVTKGLDVRRQMSLAAISLNYYNRDPQTVDTTKLQAEMVEKYTPYKYVPGTHFQTAFTHLEGYSAIYYTYMWSLVIARDLLTRFEKEGMMNHKTAMSYRENVLEPGPSKPAATVVTNFLGRPYNFDAYQHWLNTE
jgi:thimet oligopeptidase